MEWTKQQQKAIFHRGEDILVNASAGSGKTAVLAARVAEYIQGGGSFEKLLIVTFTHLAAGEMRQRIADEIEKRAEETGSAHLKRQSLLLYKARICTIDSFCLDLLRQNFAAAGVPADLRVMEPAEAEVLKAQTVREVLEDCYAAFPPGFDALLELFGGGEDQKLRDAATTLLFRTESLPFPEKKLEQWSAAAGDPELWISAACGEMLREMTQWRDTWRFLLSHSKLGEHPSPQQDLALLEELCAALEAENWDEACRLATGFRFPTAMRVTGADEAPGRKTPLDPQAPESGPYYLVQYKFLREILKKSVGSSEIFYCTSAHTRADLARLAPALRCLFGIVGECRRRLGEAYRKKGAYSFAALSERALAAVAADYRPQDGSFTPTALGQALREQYEEVLIDEYQDVNDLQDLLFRAVTHNTLFAVGDAKQSIYRFRGANPGNFLRRAEDCKVIPLNRNFRSRPGVLQFANFLCRGLFSLRTGGLEYTADQALDPGREPSGEADAFVVLVDKDSGLTGPQAVAQEIRRRVGVLQIPEKDGTLRPARYGDFAILLRKTKHLAAEYQDALARAEIPCAAQSSENFLDAPEVGNVLAFLRAIENPYDDIPLFAALTGPVMDLTDEMVARIRLCGGETLYDSLLRGADTLPYARSAVDTLRHWQLLSRSLSVRRLLWQLYARHGLINQAAGDEDPGVRERLMKLYDFAGAFGGEGGLYAFLQGAEQTAELGRKEDRPAGDGDGVRILSIHGSKGLEFPVVLLPDWDRQENRDDEKGALLLDPDLGPATRLRNPQGTVEMTTLMLEVLLRRERTKSVSETLRLLYVALTRAREQVILVADLTRKKREFSNYIGACTPQGKVLSNVLCDGAEPLTAILARLAHHPDGGMICPGRPWWEQPEPGRVCVQRAVWEEREPKGEAVRPSVLSCGLTEEELKRRFSFVHQSALSKVPAKVSVTEIAKKAPDPGSAVLFGPTHTMTPRFLTQQGLTPAERGTAVHRFCQYADLNAPAEEELRRLEGEGILTPVQARAVDLAAAEKFFASPLADAVRSARQIWREEAFVTRIPVSFYTEDDAGSGTLLMQGAIDLLCDTPEGLLLVDFKTDRTGPEELRARYAKQIRLYDYAVQRLFGRPVARAALWSFHTGCAVEISADDGPRR